jgi:radical SAM family uncharacterized protein/radical SAM-linked protein
MDNLLPQVQKPARYIGQEINLVRKNPADVKARIALAFPDVYDVGMSHLGLKVLYSVVNARPDLAAERAFAPWPDMEELLRREGAPLTSLETGTPLARFDIVGFSLQYELCATTVLQMLDLGGIPLGASDRGPEHPFVIAGGPVAFNPVPMAPFFDAFAIGDGEELILELADVFIQWKNDGASRDELLKRWKGLPGIFVPSLHAAGEWVGRRILADLEMVEAPDGLIVPYCETVHDRVAVEIARGCTRGCRFCQAGILYRPVREREADTVMKMASRSLRSTGWEEVALLSLSSGDYSCIGHLLRTLSEELGRDTVAISLPSLRTETFEQDMAEQIRKVRKTGFTLAPEAGTERLRRVINKGNTEEDLEKAVSTAFQAGWQAVKLYFMLGLPLETDEDLDGIVGLVRKASKWARGGKVTAALSTFVPKAHTPFQWTAQISIEETRRRQAYIERYFRKGWAQVKFHSPRASYLEGILARGDGRLAEVIAQAFRAGARFDGWHERLKWDAWMEAFEMSGLDPEGYLRARDTTEELPWSFIHTGVDPDYLLREWNRALAEEPTGDCRRGDCEGCGVCDFEHIYPRKATPPVVQFQRSDSAEYKQTAEYKQQRFRLRYAKMGKMRFLSHHDVVRAFHRAFRRAEIKLAYSKGFHPHPKLRFSPPLSLGVESTAEYVDFDVVNQHANPSTVGEALSRNLPAGFALMELTEISLSEPPVSAKIQQVSYEIRSFGSVSSDEIRDKIRAFNARETFPIEVKRKGKTRSMDLRASVEKLELSDSGVTMVIKSGPSGSINPLDAIAAILGRSREEVRSMNIIKTAVEFGQPSAAVEVAPR